MAKGLKTMGRPAYERLSDQVLPCGSAFSQARNSDSLLQLPLLQTGLTDFLESVLAHLQVYHVHRTYLLSVYFYLLDRLDMKPLCLDVTQAGLIN